MPKKKKRVIKRTRKHVLSAPPHLFFYIVVFFVIFTVTFFLFSNFNWAKSASVQNDTTENTLMGTYSGTTPCADCKGIETKLSLYENSYGNPTSYILKMTYVGRDTTPFIETGTWTATKGKQAIITLVPANSTGVMYYQILSASQIRQLDGDRNPIPSSLPFTLTKN